MEQRVNIQFCTLNQSSATRNLTDRSALRSSSATQLLEEGRLSRCILGIAKVAEANANQAKALRSVQANTVPERERNASQFITRRRWRAWDARTIGRSPSLTASGTPCRNCPAGNTTLLVRFAFVRSFAFLVLLFVQRGAVHEKQMPFMAGEGACPSAPSSPRVRRSSSETQRLDGRTGRSTRRVWPGRADSFNTSKLRTIREDRDSQECDDCSDARDKPQPPGKLRLAGGRNRC